MAEGARLESVYTATYRGFESPPHRHIQERARTKVRAFCLYVSPKPRGDENHRPGFDNWRSQLDRPGAQRTGCPEGASKASQSPPHRHIQERARTKVRAFCLYVSPKPRGDENHRPGFDNWRSQLDRPGAQRTGCPEGASKASQSPPHRHLKERARTKVRAFFSHKATLQGG